MNKNHQWAADILKEKITGLGDDEIINLTRELVQSCDKDKFFPELITDFLSGRTDGFDGLRDAAYRSAIQLVVDNAGDYRGVLARMALWATTDQGSQQDRFFAVIKDYVLIRRREIAREIAGDEDATDDVFSSASAIWALGDVFEMVEREENAWMLKLRGEE